MRQHRQRPKEKDKLTHDIQEKPVETSQYISTNYPVSQSYIYQTLVVHDSPASRTEYLKQPPCSVRDAISETLHELPGKTAKRQELQFDLLKSSKVFNNLPFLPSKYPDI